LQSSAVTIFCILVYGAGIKVVHGVDQLLLKLTGPLAFLAASRRQPRSHTRPATEATTRIRFDCGKCPDHRCAMHPVPTISAIMEWPFNTCTKLLSIGTDILFAGE